MNVSGNEKKYESKNFLKQILIKNFLKQVELLVEYSRIETILDAGCGEGFVVSFLKENMQKGVLDRTSINGFDSSKKAVEKAKAVFGEMNVFVGDVYDISQEDDSFELILLLEILEHLEDPEKALKEIKRVTSEYVIISVPWEPFFSFSNLLFGKNVSRLGRDEEHINFWSVKEISNIVSRYFIIEKVAIHFPWTMILARKKQ